MTMWVSRSGYGLSRCLPLYSVYCRDRLLVHPPHRHISFPRYTSRFRGFGCGRWSLPLSGSGCGGCQRFFFAIVVLSGVAFVDAADSVEEFSADVCSGVPLIVLKWGDVFAFDPLVEGVSFQVGDDPPGVVSGDGRVWVSFGDGPVVGEVDEGEVVFVFVGELAAGAGSDVFESVGAVALEDFSSAVDAGDGFHSVCSSY